jgi:glycosyltransferase involved in cell wall biosynthesis
MRVLHLSARSDTGGGPEMIRTLVQGALDHAEHWVACPQDGAYAEIFRRLLGASRVLSFPVNTARVRPDIIHTHGFGAGLLGRLSSLGSGVPVVHTFHGFFPRGSGLLGGTLRLAAEFALAPAARAAVAVSESERSLVQQLCPHLARRTVVIPNGVRPRFASRTPPVTPLLVRILVVGRLVRQKFPELAVRVAAACRRLDPTLEFEFRFAGAGPLHFETVAEARRREVLPNIRLLGDLPDLGPELSSAHIYLSTARWEGLSLALLEAMHAGLPCVASRVQGNIDAIDHGRTGFLFDLDDPAAAAAHIVNLARDPIARRAYGVQAQAAAQLRFSVEAMCSRYLDLYRSVTAPLREPVVPACARSQS